MEKLLSIIIPIYNVEKYIKDCVLSIIKQTVFNIEIIFVNDGSTDSSMSILTDILNKESIEVQNCFKIINQLNQGQSSARNNAIEIAEGEYIAFLDSDDFLSKDYINKVINVIQNNNPDIIRISAEKFYIDSNEKMKSMKFHQDKYSRLYEINTELRIDIFNENHWYPWLSIIKKELIEIDFPVGYYFEDAVFMSALYLKSKNIYFLNEKLYFYRHNLESSLNSKNRKNINKIEESLNFCLKYFSKKMVSEKLYSIIFLNFLRAYCIFLLENNEFIKSFKIHWKYKSFFRNCSTSLLTKNGIKYYRNFGYIFLILLFLKNS